MKKILLLSTIAGIAASVAAVTPAMAQTATGSFTVNSTTTKLCTTPLAANISLGEYNGTTVATATTPIVFKCTATTPATVTLAAGNGSATAGILTPSGGGTPINYTLGVTDGSVIGLGLTTGTATDLTATGTVSVAANQNPTPGSYTDTVNVTVTY